MERTGRGDDLRPRTPEDEARLQHMQQMQETRRAAAREDAEQGAGFWARKQ